MWRPEHRGVGMAFQNFALFPHMSRLREHRQPARRRATAPRGAVKAGVDEVAQLLKIDHVLSHAPRELSNGQKQRTALARALVGVAARSCCSTIPLRNVDAKLRFEMRLELPRLLRSSGLDGALCDAGLQGGDGARRPHRRAARRPFVQVATPDDDLSRAGDARRGAAVRRSDDQPRSTPHRDCGEWRRLAHRRHARSVSGALRATRRPRADRSASGRRRSWSTRRGAGRASRSTSMAVTPLNERTVLLLQGAERRGIPRLAAGETEAPSPAAAAAGRGSRFDAARPAPVRRGERPAHLAAGALSGTVMADSLVLDTVDKIYRPRGKPPVHAVKALSLDIKPGEIVALLGSSGCGKTSHAAHDRRLRGRHRAAPSARRHGRSTHLPPAQRDVAMAFEGYSLYPPLTVRENIAFALKCGAAAGAEIEQARRATSPSCWRSPTSSTAIPSSISGGQQQRASLARALVRQRRALPARRADGRSSSRNCAPCCAAASSTICASTA